MDRGKEGGTQKEGKKDKKREERERVIHGSCVH